MLPEHILNFSTFGILFMLFSQSNRFFFRLLVKSLIPTQSPVSVSPFCICPSFLPFFESGLD